MKSDKLKVSLYKEQLEKLSGRKVILIEKFDSKDEQRIRDIMDKANGNVEKAKQLAQAMANKIEDPIKAHSRGEAAENDNYHDIAKIFFDRAEALGNPEPGIRRQNADLKTQQDQKAQAAKAVHQQQLAQANPRDVERVKEINIGSTTDREKRGKAEKMAKLIKDPTKAYNRYLAAVEVFGNGSIARTFLDRAIELKHPDALNLKDQQDKDWRSNYDIRRQQTLARAKLKADAFIKEFKRRYPDFANSVSISSYSPVQYQSGNGETYYVEFDGGEKLRKGLAGLGDQRGMSPMHQGINSLARKFGGYYDYNYGKSFVSFSGK